MVKWVFKDSREVLWVALVWEEESLWHLLDNEFKQISDKT